MKLVSAIILAMVLMSPAVFGAHAMTIGSGVGSLSFTVADDHGFINGSDCTFDATGSSPGTTVWNWCWAIYDVAGDNIYYVDDFTGTHAAPNEPTGGTPSATATSLDTTGIAFPNTAALTADLNMTLTAPTPGDTARVTSSWTLSNSGGTALDVRVFFFLDLDLDLDGGSYATDMVALVPSTINGGIALACGNITGLGPAGFYTLDLNAGILTECVSHVPTAVAALQNSAGASYYWSDYAPYYDTTGIDGNREIVPPLRNAVENDTIVADYLSDDGSDSGYVMQVDVSVPAAGSETVTIQSTWGENQVLSAGSLPAELSVLTSD
ncbi:hypothetical protein JXA47_17595 [Candidatus Sumerlaeota bacterium]|nr:hypothetical protein [Candidatus Sumerlaeota bacterium]